MGGPMPGEIRDKLKPGESRGRLQITVSKGADLYRRVEGWAYGAMLGGEVAEARLVSRSDEVLSKILGDRGRRR
ncbi:hypothetical protein ACLQ2P_12525 [Actinomadura citrea]|uniref:hypothetical protein n=1 Tax=Actinomadura citrea TaxID=46158 RepID=UPI003CE53901